MESSPVQGSQGKHIPPGMEFITHQNRRKSPICSTAGNQKMKHFSPMEIKKGSNKMAKKPAPGAGHNGTGLTEDQEKVFVVELQNFTDAESSMAEKKGSMSGIMKRLESAGFTPEHIKWAKRLKKENVASIIGDLKMKIGIARLLGHAAGRQLDIFDDRTPLEDAAYLEGLSDGKMGVANANPYGMDTAAGQRWQQGSNEGHTLRNAWLNEAINGKPPAAEIIKGDADVEDETEEAGNEAEAVAAVEVVQEAPAVADIPFADAAEDADTGNLGRGDGVEREEGAVPVEVAPAAASDDWDNETPPPRAA